MNKLFFISIITFALASCSLLSPVKVETSTKYMINITPPYVHAIKTYKGTLLVLTPETYPVYNTTQMAYSIKPHQVAYFSRNEWAATPAQMLQPLLTHTLRNTHSFHAVATQPFIGHYDYILSTNILELKQNFTCHPAVLQMKVNAQLINASTNKIIANQLFAEDQPMAQRTPYAGVFAANHATENILRRIAMFCSEHVMVKIK